MLIWILSTFPYYKVGWRNYWLDKTLKMMEFTSGTNWASFEIS